MGKEKILCIIPARGGSKGVKRKNIRVLKGKPLIGWTIDAVINSYMADRVIVSTEDEEISQISRQNGAEVINRPLELAQDTTSTMDVVLHTLKVLKKQGYLPDYVMLAQCTSPLRNSGHIENAIKALVSEKQNADSLISVKIVEHPPWWYKTIDEKGYTVDFISYDKNKFVRRQDFPLVYSINGAIYIAKTDKLEYYMDFETEHTIPFVMDAISSLDIDSELDFELAEFYMTKQQY